jgi:hypothetical protein
MYQIPTSGSGLHVMIMIYPEIHTYVMSIPMSLQVNYTLFNRILQPIQAEIARAGNRISWMKTPTVYDWANQLKMPMLSLVSSQISA